MKNLKLKTYRQPNKIIQVINKVKNISRGLLGEEVFIDMKERGEQKRAVKKAYRDARFNAEIKKAKIAGENSVIEGQPKKQGAFNVFGGDFFDKGTKMP